MVSNEVVWPAIMDWLMMKFVLENCLLDLFVVLDLDLGSILIDKSFFLSLKSWI
jgi:hypothetical protein